jgi:hypothetical protein
VTDDDAGAGVVLAPISLVCVRPWQVAPLIRSNVEQLQFNWKKVDEEYARLLQAKNDLGTCLFFAAPLLCCSVLMGVVHCTGVDDPQLLVDSKLPDYFNGMVDALVKEEEDETVEGTGLCVQPCVCLLCTHSFSSIG